MIFNAENYPQIRDACMKHLEIQFEAPIEITAFASSNVPVPDEWRAFPPAALPPEGYAQIFALASRDAQGELMKLELLVHLDGGRVLYKKAANNIVSLKITWPR